MPAHEQPGSDLELGGLAPAVEQQSAPGPALARSFASALGNQAFAAMVARQALLRQGATVMDEDEVTGTPGVARDLTAQDRGLLEAAKKDLASADGGVQSAKVAMGSLEGEAIPAVDAVGALFAQISAIYDEAQAIHANVVGRAQFANAVDKAMLSVVVETLWGFIPAPKGLIEGALTDLAGSLKPLASTVLRQAAAPLDKIIADAKTAAGSNAPPSAAASPEWAKRLTFYVSYADSWRSLAKLLPLAGALGDVNREVGVYRERVDGMLESGKTRAEHTPAGIARDAGEILVASRELDGVPTAIRALTQKFDGVRANLESVKPTPTDAEKEIWIRWAGNLRGGQTDEMDVKIIEDHLKQLGIFEQLGVDIGAYFSFREEDLANFSAEAQTRVLNHKGQVFEVEADGSKLLTRIQISDPAIPVAGIPGQLSPIKSGKGQAVLVGAMAPGTLEPMLYNDVKSREGVLRRLFGDGKVVAQLRPLPGGWSEDSGAPSP